MNAAGILLTSACTAGLTLATATAQPTLQTNLQQKIQASAAQAKGKVQVDCALPGITLDCALDASARPPMQSVFKLPLAVAVLAQVEKGKLWLDQPVRFLPTDRIPHAYSPLQDRYPQANVDVPLHELLRLAVSLSDNCAADILLRVAGGPHAVQSYIHSLKVKGFQLHDGEAALHRDVQAQYRNTFQPAAAVALLRLLNDRSPLNEANTRLLFQWMRTPPDRPSRIQQGLPKGSEVFHKTGSSDVSPTGLAYATNDIGLITLPDGRRLALAVFVTDSSADPATRDKVIADIAREIYDAALQTRK